MGSVAICGYRWWNLRLVFNGPIRVLEQPALLFFVLLRRLSLLFVRFSLQLRLRLLLSLLVRVQRFLLLLGFLVGPPVAFGGTRVLSMNRRRPCSAERKQHHQGNHSFHPRIFLSPQSDASLYRSRPLRDVVRA